MSMSKATEQIIFNEITRSRKHGTCEYCNYALPIPYQYAYEFSDWIDIEIDGATLFVQIGNSELAIPINFCPKCGRKINQ